MGGGVSVTVNTSSERTHISTRVGDDNRAADAESIVDGVEQAVGNVESFTVFIRAFGDVTVSVYLSPDGGESWYEMSESPVEITLGSQQDHADETVHLNYNASRLRLEGDSDAPVSAQVREVV